MVVIIEWYATKSVFMCRSFSIFEVCQNPLKFRMFAPPTCSSILPYKHVKLRDEIVT